MRRFVIIGVVCMAGAAIAGVLTARVEAQPRFERLLAEVPPFPGSFTYPLGTKLHVDGVPREMGWAQTDSSPEGVVQRYVGLWTSRGLRVDRYGDGTELSAVASSAGDPLVRSVVATRRADGKTLIIASLSEPAAERDTNVPLPPGCEEVRSTGARDGRVVTEVTVLDCAMPIEQLMLYFDNQGGVRDAMVLPESGRPDLHATWSFGTTSHATVLATQTSDAPPRTVATITWQEER